MPYQSTVDLSQEHLIQQMALYLQIQGRDPRLVNQLKNSGGGL